MHLPNAFLALPPSLLVLLTTQLSPSTAVGAAQQDNNAHLPTAVRKMAPDENEKFMPEDFAFAPFAALLTDRALPDDPHLLSPPSPSFLLTPEEEALLAANSSASIVLRPPYPLHHRDSEDVQQQQQLQQKQRELDRRHRPTTEDKNQNRRWVPGGGSIYLRARDALARLQGKRDFTCPTGTHSCTNIGEPSYCCPDETTCFTVQNAPLSGNVGCCPNGQTCGDSVGACPAGSMQCLVSQGGGCCIPGFVCASAGCVASSSLSVITSTRTSTTSVAGPTPSQSVVTVTTVITITPSNSPPRTSTQTVTRTASTTPKSSSSGGGGGGLPPDRGTSSSPEPTKGASTTQTTTASYCPTGFYACLASAGSGCCRTGRDCSTTSCPPVPSTTIVESGDKTIVVPVSDATAAATGADTCASGWFLCGKDAGSIAGCCPSGYVCGTASCTLSAATATATVQKELPGAGSRVMDFEQWKTLLLLGAIGFAVAFVG